MDEKFPRTVKMKARDGKVSDGLMFILHSSYSRTTVCYSTTVIVSSENITKLLRRYYDRRPSVVIGNEQRPKIAKAD